MSIYDQPIRTFLAAAASDAPTPGGGSVAALAAALGASMTSMVANLTQGAKFAGLEREMKDVAAAMTKTIAETEDLLQADMVSFQSYMDALKLPKGTDEEKTARSQALQAASVQATEVPLRLAASCRDALLRSQAIAETANKNVISDLGIAAFLLEAAAQSALLTVDINLPGLRDIARKEAFTEERNNLEREVTALKADVARIVRERLA